MRLFFVLNTDIHSKIKHGTITVTLTSSSTTYVTFDSPFETVPDVVATAWNLNTGTHTKCTIAQVSVNGFTVIVSNNDSTASKEVKFSWIAMNI